MSELDFKYEDITEFIFSLSKSLKYYKGITDNNTIDSPTFVLQESMSATEIGDPKMD